MALIFKNDKMKRLLFILLITNVLQAQTNEIEYEDVELYIDAGIDGSGELTSVTFKELGPIIHGDVYLYTSWNNKAKFITKTNKVYKVSKLNYNIMKDAFQLKIAKDSVYTLSDNNIQKIEIDNAVFKKFDNIVNSNGFYEVLFAGEKNVLLKKHTVRLITGKLNPLNGITEPNKYHKEVRYFIKKDTKLKVLRLRKKHLFSHFKEQQKSLNKFIKSEKLVMKDQKDFIKVLQYIESFLD